MSVPVFYPVEIVALDRIQVPERLFPVREAQVLVLTASIRLVGLLHPILVTRSGVLVAGAHRLEACRRLGWPAIPASIIDDDDDAKARAIEVEENRVRIDDYSVLVQCLMLAEVNAYLESIDARAPAHRPRLDDGDRVTTEEIGAELGLKVRAAQRRIKVANQLDPAAVDVLQDTPRAEELSLRQLTDLSEVDAEAQRGMARRFAAEPDRDFDWILAGGVLTVAPAPDVPPAAVELAQRAAALLAEAAALAPETFGGVSRSLGRVLDGLPETVAPAPMPADDVAEGVPDDGVHAEGAPGDGAPEDDDASAEPGAEADAEAEAEAEADAEAEGEAEADPAASAEVGAAVRAAIAALSTPQPKDAVRAASAVVGEAPAGSDGRTPLGLPAGAGWAKLAEAVAARLGARTDAGHVVGSGAARAGVRAVLGWFRTFVGAMPEGEWDAAAGRAARSLGAPRRR